MTLKQNKVNLVLNQLFFWNMGPLEKSTVIDYKSIIKIPQKPFYSLVNLKLKKRSYL